ncbi:MAG: hypothetical protein GX462_00205 [Thermotogaceae bacterium]|nr:hypothetical protein [Thermotogaceae bacterium]
MKKALLVVLVLVFAMSLSFAAAGKVSFLVDKGVVTAGDPVKVTFTLEETEVEEGLTTISVLGEQLTPNVWVMLVQGGNAQYEATKAVDEEGKKTVYYIRAMELKGQKVTLYAKLTDWNGKVIKQEKKDVQWKEDAYSDVIALVPAAEGIYSIDASITLEDGTVIAMGAGQLVALKKYIEQKVAGLEPYLSPSQYSLTVKTGVEFMKKFDSEASTATHLSIYGQGKQLIPDLKWTWTRKNQPVMGDVEVVYESKADTGRSIDTAYIKFKVLSEALEGDCCGASAGDKWALWLAIGTGEYHEMYKASYSLKNCCTAFHYLGVNYSKSWAWSILKGGDCRGWIKAIFYLDPADVKIWLYAIIGTTWEETIGIPDWPSGGSQGAGNPKDSDGGYKANLLYNAELNIFADIIFKDIVTLKLMAINIPITAVDLKPVYGASIGVDLGKIGLGAAWRYDTAEQLNASVWAAHLVLKQLLSFNIPGGFPFEALNNIGFGFFAAGDLGYHTNPSTTAISFNVTHLQLIMELGADITCCFPAIHVGLHLTKMDREQGSGLLSGFGLSEIWGKYSHQLGVYGPVTLKGTLGVIYAFEGGYVDKSVKCGGWGGFGQSIFSGPAIGVAYEVEGSLTW